MATQKAEVHLFIVWGSASSYRQQILSDIREKFKLLLVEAVSWDIDCFSENLTRFYGESLPKKSNKELECSTSEFLVVLVLDEQPEYQYRTTSKGLKLVNVRMFDSKSKYRILTGGGHKIHSTNTVEESRHDILMLTHKPYDYYLQEERFLEDLNVQRNLLGCIQWRSLKELFQALNQTTEYVVLRNFKQMPDAFFDGDHGDIDILVRDKAAVVHLLNAKKLFKLWYRVHYVICVNYRYIRFDIRYVGDGYYDRSWEDLILKNRVLYNGFYVPADEDYRYSMLYHALVHKKNLSIDYSNKLTELGFSLESLTSDLLRYTEKQRYEFTYPKDLTVYFNAKLVGKQTSIIRIIYGRLKTTKIYLNSMCNYLFTYSRYVYRKIFY